MFRTKWFRSGAAGALILTGVILAGAVANQTFTGGKPTAFRATARLSIEHESDAPSPEFMRRRFGFGNAPYSLPPPLAPASPAAPTAPMAISNWVQVGPAQITDVGSNTIYEPSLGR